MFPNSRWLATAGLAAFGLAIARGTCAAQTEAELAKASQNPIANLNSVPLQFNFTSGGGLGSMSNLVFNVQPVLPLPIDKQWLFVSRTVVPYVNTPLPDSTRRGGIADIQEQGYLTPRTPKKITWGIGPILSVPTATNNVTRTGQWALGPTGVVLMMPGPWVIGVLANNLWRIGGVDHGLPVNELTMQPFINLNLPNAWSITTAPLITSNWSATPDQRWTVPLGIGLGKVTHIEQQALSLGMQYYHNVNHPRTDGSDEMRFVVSFLYPIAKR